MDVYIYILIFVFLFSSVAIGSKLNRGFVGDMPLDPALLNFLTRLAGFVAIPWFIYGLFIYWWLPLIGFFIFFVFFNSFGSRYFVGPFFGMLCSVSGLTLAIGWIIVRFLQ